MPALMAKPPHTSQTKSTAASASGLMPALRMAETCVVRPEAGHGHRQQHGVDVDHLRHHRMGQQRERVEPGDRHETEGEPGNHDAAAWRGFAFVAAVDSIGILGAGAGEVSRQDDQERRQHHHADHLGDDGGVRSLLADGTTGSDHLCHFVDGRAGEHAVSGRRQVEQPVLSDQVIQHRIQEDRQRAEHHHRGHRDHHLLGATAHDGFGRHHRCRAADRTAGADQHGRLAVEPEDSGAEEAGEPEGAAQHRGVDRDAGPAHVTDVLEGQAQAVQDDAQAQQVGLGKGHAGAGRGADARVDGVADHHAQHDGQGQRADAVGLQPADLAQLDRREGQRARQCEARDHRRTRRIAAGVCVR